MWFVSLTVLLGLWAPSAPEVRVEHRPQDSRVDISIGGQPFTSYLYGAEFDKPIFHPVRDARGLIVTRGYPMRTDVAGEHQDHPHHQSLWLTYGDINDQLNYWAKSPGKPAQIRHRQVVKAESGAEGLLVTEADWVTPDGKVVLRQRNEARFSGQADRRVMDLSYTLTAGDGKVVFNDTKEGMFGIRVATSMREDNSGRYLNAEGLETEKQVWGKRSPWVALRGQVENKDLTIAILNHPSSTQFPTYWHARGYGLFAANPFGVKDFTKGAEPLNYTLQPGQSATFKYRVLIHSGKLGGDQMAKEFQSYKVH